MIQHLQNQTKHTTSFFGGGVIKSTKHCPRWPLFGTKPKTVIMMLPRITNNENTSFGSKNKKLTNIKPITPVPIKI
jgi:hypothetical protein